MWETLNRYFNVFQTLTQMHFVQERDLHTNVLHCGQEASVELFQGTIATNFFLLKSTLYKCITKYLEKQKEDKILK